MQSRLVIRYAKVAFSKKILFLLVNQTSFENLNDKEAIAVLKKAAKQKRTLTLYVAKRPRMSDQRSDALSALCETLPVDVSLWVEMTSQAPPPKPFETTMEDGVGGNPTGGRKFKSSPLLRLIISRHSH